MSTADNVPQGPQRTKQVRPRRLDLRGFHAVQLNRFGPRPIRCLEQAFNFTPAGLTSRSGWPGKRNPMGLVITAVIGLLLLLGITQVGKAPPALTGSEPSDFDNTSRWNDALGEDNQDDLDLRS